MNIDLFTLIAQIINFLILVALLKLILYKRIIKVMDEREKRIALRLEEAESKRKDAEKESESYLEKKQELQDQREKILSEAKKEAETRRKELIKGARDDVERSKARWNEAIQHQKESFLADLRHRSGEQIFGMARRALKDLANDELEQHIIETFIGRIQKLKKDEKEVIVKSIRESKRGVLIKSAFEIPKKMQQRIQRTLQDQIGESIDMQFETSSDLIGGVELNADGKKITWSFDGYLDILEERLSEVIEKKASQKSKAEGGKEEKNKKKTEDTKTEDSENEKGKRE